MYHFHGVQSHSRASGDMAQAPGAQMRGMILQHRRLGLWRRGIGPRSVISVTQDVVCSLPALTTPMVQAAIAAAAVV